jgi:site-specific DNA recombinase
MRLAIYARYSSDQLRDASIEDQIRLCRSRAEREGWTVVATFADQAISGATNQRPEFQGLSKEVRAGQFDMVMAESLDRFSRDLEHIAALYKICIFHRVRIHTVCEGEVSELILGMKGTMGSIYLKDLAEKTRRGLDGRSSDAILAKLEILETQLRTFEGDPAPTTFTTRPAPGYCATKVRDLNAALAAGCDPELLEAARALIDKVIIHPPQDDDEPPGVELVGDLMAMLQAAGVGQTFTKDGAPAKDPVLAAFVSSVRATPGACARHDGS